MAKKAKKLAPAAPANGNGVMALVKELCQAAVTMRGSIESADYKRYVLPIIFLRFLSLRYERRRQELEQMIANPKSDYYSVGAFSCPRRPAGIRMSRTPKPTTSKSASTTSSNCLRRSTASSSKVSPPHLFGSNLDAKNVGGFVAVLD